ncbi:hypothetical protein HKCCE2091_00535 [Rhodobacterales bacterium HKCCE2091]|nr:hypothetical protein [Rhodobacterales bacterium HKCCE2091]
MKIKVSQDAEAPADRVFAAITDADRIEAVLRGRGVRIDRVGGWTELGPGVAWEGEGEVRGRRREIAARVVAMVPGRSLELEARIGGLRVAQEILLVPLGHRVTRIGSVTDLRPDSLGARLFVQSLKLARPRVLARMQARLAAEVARVEKG